MQIEQHQGESIKHSVEDAKVMYNGNEQVPVSDMENKNGEVSSIVVEEGDANIEKLPVLEVEKKKKRKKRKSKASVSGKENCVELESNDVSGLSLAENTNIDSTKEVGIVVSGDANIEKLPEGEKKKKRKRKVKLSPSRRKQIVVEEGKENCVEHESNEKRNEVSRLSLAENTNIDSTKEADIVVPGDANIEKHPVLEGEKKKKRKRKVKLSPSRRKQIVVEEGKENCVELESNEVSGLSLAENTNIVSGDANIEKLPEGEKKKKRKRKVKLSASRKKQMVVEEAKEICVQSESNEVSAIGLAENTNIDSIKEVDVVVSGDANIEKLPVLEVGKKKKKKRKSKASVSEKLPLVSRKKLLVLDLNGLLADIVPRCAEYKSDFYCGGKAVFKRPFCEEFLKFCFDKFKVAIWSSRMKRNVKTITELLLGDMKRKLLFCWDMSHCTKTKIGSLENKNKYIVFKDLNQVWKKGVYNATNTVLLDDSPYKALLNPPYTAIFPQSYNHLNKTDTSLGNGGDLRLYLEKLAEAENVQDFIKENPFGQESITEGSENWEFYKKAMHGKSNFSHK